MISCYLLHEYYLIGLPIVWQDFGDLNRLVGVITREVAGEGAEKEGRKATGGGEHTKDIDGLVSKTPCTHGLSWEICTRV